MVFLHRIEMKQGFSSLIKSCVLSVAFSHFQFHLLTFCSYDTYC